MKLYFSIGFTNNKILNLLAYHIIISIRTLKRLCKKLSVPKKEPHGLGEITSFVAVVGYICMLFKGVLLFLNKQ